MAAVLAACWTSQQPPPADPAITTSAPPPSPDAAPDAPATSAQRALAAMAGFRDRMCKCTDRACANQVTEDMTRWGEEAARAADQPPRRLSHDETRIAQELGDAMVKCMADLMRGSASSP